MLWKRCAAKCELLDAGYALQPAGKSVQFGKSVDHFSTPVGRPPFSSAACGELH